MQINIAVRYQLPQLGQYYQNDKKWPVLTRTQRKRKSHTLLMGMSFGVPTVENVSSSNIENRIII